MPPIQDVSLPWRREPGQVDLGVSSIINGKTVQSFQASLSTTLFKGKDGSIRTSTIIRDITERKQVEKGREQLLDIICQEKNRLVSLIDNITDEIWFADLQENFTLVNPSGRREFGMSDY
jgi:PAS domain-containing protein